MEEDRENSKVLSAIFSRILSPKKKKKVIRAFQSLQKLMQKL